MPRTRNHAKAGKTDYFVSLQVIIPLDDRTATGNLGMEGADEEFFSIVAPTLGLAKHAAMRLRTQALQKFKWTSIVFGTCQIEQGHWVETTFEDVYHGHETVYDAVRERDSILEGHYDDDKGVFQWDDDK